MFLCFLVPSLTCAAGEEGREVTASVLRQVYLIQTTTAQLRHHFSFRMEVKVALIINTKHKNRKQKIETETETKIETESDITTTTTTDRRGGYLGQTRRRC